MIPALKFTEADAHRAHEEWGSNCGPGAIAAVLGMSLDELRPHLEQFEQRGYTNPTMMWRILEGLGVSYRRQRPVNNWPTFGLAVVQWHGPWTAPGARRNDRYRYTHWVGVHTQIGTADVGIFDINAMNSGGWVREVDWATTIVPWIMADEPRYSGIWSLNHSVEILGREG